MPASLGLRQFYSAVIPVGHTIGSIALTSDSAALVAGLSIDQVNEELDYNGTSPVAFSNVGIDVTTVPPVSGGNAALADWNASKAEPNVLWAHDYQSLGDVTKFTGRQSNQSAGIGPNTVNYKQFIPDGGTIPGYGCFRQFLPLAAGTNGPSSGYIWGRPIQPMAAGNGWAADINNPGVPTRPAVPTSQAWNEQNAYVMHPDYAAAPHGTPARTGVSIASEVWICAWVRFSVGRQFGAGNGDSKMIMLETNNQGGNQEIVMNGRSQNGPNAFPQVYTGKFNTTGNALERPQAANPGSSGIKEPGGTYVIPSGPFAGQQVGAVANSNNGINAFWAWQENVWQRVLLHWKPGHQAAGAGVNIPVSDPSNDGARDTLVEIFVARGNEIDWTCIHSVPDYVWGYSNDVRWNSGGGLHAYGLNWFNLDYFTGGMVWDQQGSDWYHDFDRVLCAIGPTRPRCPAPLAA